MFAVVLMSTSCEKQNDDDVNVIPTDLTGAKWNCVSLDYAGTLYDTPAEFATLNLTKDFVSLDFKFNADFSVTLFTNYTGTNNNTANWGSDTYSKYAYSISGDGLLDIDGGYLQFQIISYTTSKLVMKMTKGNVDPNNPNNPYNMPVGGTYTLTR
jgi:hypothetical protein